MWDPVLLPVIMWHRTARRRRRALPQYTQRCTTSTREDSVLRLTGRDALDLLHRISTQALLDLPPGGSRATLFCDFRGRLLHRAHVVRDADFVWLVRHDAPASELLEFVDRHRFREDVRLEDRPVSEAPALPEDEIGRAHV